MELRAIAANDDRALAEPVPTARVVYLGENSITVRAVFWVDDPVRTASADVRSDFRRRIKHQFDEEGITLAPPSGQYLSGSVELEGADTPESPT
jgi:small-conductance mechanosensitive channel